ncbi:MAG: DNA polymerase III subunit chi [Candidatus Competibacterales bacterium]|nr:DNA polymerase III subunit chi [Candidatus Competibacterales bacterium]
MGPQVDFYVLGEDSDGDRLRLACRLAEKAYEHGHGVYLLAADEDQARQLDERLWTFRQNSFVPHARYPAPQGEGAPVLIGTEAEPEGAGEVLINLAAEVPAGYDRFRRVVELVNQEPAVLAASRERFRFYRRQSLEPTSHRL